MDAVLYLAELFSQNLGILEWSGENNQTLTDTLRKISGALENLGGILIPSIGGSRLFLLKSTQQSNHNMKKVGSTKDGAQAHAKCYHISQTKAAKAPKIANTMATRCHWEDPLGAGVSWEPSLSSSRTAPRFFLAWERVRTIGAKLRELIGDELNRKNKHWEINNKRNKNKSSRRDLFKIQEHQRALTSIYFVYFVWRVKEAKNTDMPLT